MPKRSARKAEEWEQIRQTMKEHRLDFYTTPGDLFWDDDISPAEARLLTFISYLDQGERGCWASNLYLSAFLNCHENTIITAIGHFQERGFIVVEPWNGYERRIHVAPEYRQLLKGEYGHTHYPKTRGTPPNKKVGLPKKSGAYKDESGKELSKGNSDARKALSNPDPEPSRKVSLEDVDPAVIEAAITSLRAHGTPVKNPATRAARAMILAEVLRQEAAP